MALSLSIDYLLYGLLALTVALIGFKATDLWWPRVTGLTGPTDASALAQRMYFVRLERGLTVLGIIASTAPFIGLMGTVLHVMEALSQVGTSLDTSVISGPIATALKATLVGLASAVPASAALAIFSRKLQVIEAGLPQSKDAG